MADINVAKPNAGTANQFAVTRRIDQIGGQGRKDTAVTFDLVQRQWRWLFSRRLGDRRFLFVRRRSVRCTCARSISSLRCGKQSRGKKRRPKGGISDDSFRYLNLLFGASPTGTVYAVLFVYSFGGWDIPQRPNT
jgi:hypothetical protein